MSMTKREVKSTEEMIKESLLKLKREGDVTEIRILNTPKGIISGYFDDERQLVEIAAEYDGEVPAIYISLNPVKPELLSRASNRINPRCQAPLMDILVDLSNVNGQWCVW